MARTNKSADSGPRWGIGNRIAPPRFILYCLLLAAAVIATFAMPGERRHVLMAGFDVATLVFLGSLLPLLGVHDPRRLAAYAEQNDANRLFMLVMALILSTVVTAVVAIELSAGSRLSGWDKGLILATLLLSWLSANTIYALHYAHLYYSKQAGALGKGLDFPGDTPPDYFDFFHFALILGMTFQTADIDITSQRIRRIATLHCFTAFIFNLGVVAFTINMLASG